jgi:tetraacyldisaccharide 4'-kinase
MHLKSQLLNFWYSNSVFAYLLLPLSWLYQLITYIRYQYLLLKGPARFHIPVIIVGNISLGGTGKTPLVGWLANELKARGYHPGIIMHGYASSLKGSQVMTVKPSSCASQVGDEALLLAKKYPFPMVAGRLRVNAIDHLIQQNPQVDIIICDDGLQHYKLARDIEIAVIDGQRRMGNGFCLPAGPLRESPKRLKTVDFVVATGEGLQNEWPMSRHLAKNVQHVTLAQTRSLDDFIGQTVHAIAGIGDPNRFFKMLQDKGINVIKHPFDDHYQYTQASLHFADDYPILMTEKDAVKCQEIAPFNAWAVLLEVSLPKEFTENLLRRLKSGQKITRHPCLPDLQATPPL